MDQELISYFDEHFRAIDSRFRSMDERLSENNHQIQSLREETSQQIQGLREETSQQIQGLREETSQQIQGLREETSQRFDQVNTRLDQANTRLDQANTRLDQANTRLEQMDDRIERVEAAGRHTGVLLEDLRRETQLVAEGVYGLDERLKAHQQEMGRQLEDVRHMIVRPYEELDSRVRALEAWRELKERDPIELIRERFGKKTS